MGRRRSVATLLALRAAFQRSGLAVAKPDPPRCQWVSGRQHEPAAKVAWDYNPWSKERMR